MDCTTRKNPEQLSAIMLGIVGAPQAVGSCRGAPMCAPMQEPTEPPESPAPVVQNRHACSVRQGQHPKNFHPTNPIFNNQDGLFSPDILPLKKQGMGSRWFPETEQELHASLAVQIW